MDDKEFIHSIFNFKGYFKYLKGRSDYHSNKDRSISEDARKAGNKLYTQKHHDQNIHNEILLQYTKSIAFAPKGSEEMALGFSNRSALLMHLHCYKECLIDIDRALEITKSDQLKSKLQSRKENCLLLVSDIKGTESKRMDISGHLELPDMVRSTKIPCAAEFVSLESNKIHKRQLTATRDIKPGEIIIIEKAYVCCPNRNQIYLACSHCLSFAWSGIPCDSCVYSIYCSETCKKKAWKEYHDVECSLLRFFYIHEDCEPVKRVLLARTFIKAIKTEGFECIMSETELIDNGSLDVFSDGILNSNKFGCIYSLRCRPQNENLKFTECVDELSVIYLLIKLTNLVPVAKQRKKLNSTDERVLIRLKDIFMKLKSIIDVNAYSHQWYKCTHNDFFACIDNCNSQRGAIIAPCSGIINHSCIPNIHRFTLPEPKLIVYAIRPVKKGEQLFISYGPAYSTDKEARNLWLETEMYYTCRCIACTDDQFYKKNINKKKAVSKMLKVFAEFKKFFGDNAMEFLLTDKLNNWTIFNEASLEQAFRLIELYFKYFEFNEVSDFIGVLHYYVRRVFHELYGEKCAMLSNC